MDKYVLKDWDSSDSQTDLKSIITYENKSFVLNSSFYKKQVSLKKKMLGFAGCLSLLVAGLGFYQSNQLNNIIQKQEKIKENYTNTIRLVQTVGHEVDKIMKIMVNVLTEKIFTVVTPLQKSQIINSIQIGHSDGYDKKGFYGVNIFSGTLQIEHNNRTIFLPIIHTINDRKKTTIIFEKKHHNYINKELTKHSMTKEMLTSHLKTIYDEVFFE